MNGMSQGAVMIAARVGALAVALVATPAWTVAADGAEKGNSAAAITAWFGDSCTSFDAHSSKDISHVELHYANGRVGKDEAVDNPDLSIRGVDELDFAVVKSGTTEERFECSSVPLGLCSDGLDNDGNGLVDYPADPGCFGPEDNDEGSD